MPLLPPNQRKASTTPGTARILVPVVLALYGMSPPPSLASTAMNALELKPGSPTNVGGCIPFGNNTSFGFTGFIYRDVPAFDLVPGQTISFDLGAQNDVDVRRNMFFAEANIDPEPYSGSSQGVAAEEWTQVVSDTQVPLNPQGNSVTGDFELVYTSEATFSFPGGGLIVGFGSSPPGNYSDEGCERVLVITTSFDVSGQFYARFFGKENLTLGALDTGSWDFVQMGGMVIGPTPLDVFACDGFAWPFEVALSLQKRVNRAIPLKTGLLDSDGFPMTDLDISAPPVVDVSFSPVVGGVTEDLTEQLVPLGQANTDNIFRFDPGTQSWVYNLGTTPYDAAGTYVVTMKSGDSTSYVIDPDCSGQFERLG